MIFFLAFVTRALRLNKKKIFKRIKKKNSFNFLNFKLIHFDEMRKLLLQSWLRARSHSTDRWQS